MDLVLPFPHLRVGLMIGIGGGALLTEESVTRKQDLRIGDVVVSLLRTDASFALVLPVRVQSKVTWGSRDVIIVPSSPFALPTCSESILFHHGKRMGLGVENNLRQGQNLVRRE